MKILCVCNQRSFKGFSSAVARRICVSIDYPKRKDATKRRALYSGFIPKRCAFSLDQQDAMTISEVTVTTIALLKCKYFYNFSHLSVAIHVVLYIGCKDGSPFQKAY